MGPAPAGTAAQGLTCDGGEWAEVTPAACRLPAFSAPGVPAPLQSPGQEPLRPSHSSFAGCSRPGRSHSARSRCQSQARLLRPLRSASVRCIHSRVTTDPSPPASASPRSAHVGPADARGDSPALRSTRARAGPSLSQGGLVVAGHSTRAGGRLCSVPPGGLPRGGVASEHLRGSSEFARRARSWGRREQRSRGAEEMWRSNPRGRDAAWSEVCPGGPPGPRAPGSDRGLCPAGYREPCRVQGSGGSQSDPGWGARGLSLGQVTSQEVLQDPGDWVAVSAGSCFGMGEGLDRGLWAWWAGSKGDFRVPGLGEQTDSVWKLQGRARQRPVPS